MKQAAYIWRKSMYDNDFKCNQCGTVCVGSDGAPNNNTLWANGLLFCRTCKNLIAKVTIVDVPEGTEPNAMMGNFEDWQKRKGMS